MEDVFLFRANTCRASTRVNRPTLDWSLHCAQCVTFPILCVSLGGGFHFSEHGASAHQLTPLYQLAFSPVPGCLDCPLCVHITCACVKLISTFVRAMLFPCTCNTSTHSCAPCSFPAYETHQQIRACHALSLHMNTHQHIRACHALFQQVLARTWLVASRTSRYRQT